MIADSTAQVAVLIVGFRNSADIRGCLAALSGAGIDPNFDVFICENGGEDAYRRLIHELVEGRGPCLAVEQRGKSCELETSRFLDVRHLRFRARSSNVWVGCANENLGYAGGINAWLDQVLNISGWKGIWILNPDTEPEPCALAALVERAETGRKGMVGSTILEAGRSDQVRFRGGLHWQKFAARSIAIGLGEHLDAPHDLLAIEAAMDSPSGASMYVTRRCIEQIGLMDESYFLFFEDLDWGVRAKASGLGYASESIVGHKRGTTTGSARDFAGMSRLSVYLQHRNGIHFVRRHFPWALPVRVLVSLLYAVRFLLGRAPNNFLATLEGVWAGLKGELGRPSWHRQAS
jgi:N-acetylglucosaminyl-diphospho-decaprenol L-rhamnosyltransferase